MAGEFRLQSPPEWKRVPLEELSDFITKGTTPTTLGFGWVDSGVLFLRSECVGERGFTTSGAQFISPDAHAAMERSVVRSGDLLVTITGNVGRVCLLPESVSEANINQHIARVRLRPDSGVLPEFACQQLSHPNYRKYFEQIVTGLAYPQISLKQVREAVLALPPLPEQRKIAAILSSVDDTIEKTEAVIDQLEVVKKGLLGELLTRGMPGRHARFRDTDAGRIPDAWKLISLENAGEWLSGGTPSKSAPAYWSGTIPWVSPKDMKRLRLNDSIDHVSDAAIGNGTRLVPAGTIFVVVRGMILAHSFPVALAERPMTFNQDMKALRPSTDFDAEFLLYWLASKCDEVLTLIADSSHGTKRLPTEAFFAMLLPMPSIEEQREIAGVLRTVDELIQKETGVVDAQRQTRAGLLDALISGWVRVTVSEEEAA